MTETIIRISDTRVDQAIARGWSTHFIMSQLGVPEATVDRRRNYLDKVNAEATYDVAPRNLRNQPIAPCGTRAARRRHRFRGERCEACVLPPQDLKPCGTSAAYARHRRRGEDCQSCREANARDRAERKNRARS